MIDRPIFERDRYEAEVTENCAVGTRLTTVHAFDADVGTNALVVYHFSTTTTRSFPDTFHIDNATGAISVSGTVDYEAYDVYQLMVTASDCGSPETLSADAIVEVRVGDANDNAPLIRINTLRATDTDVASVPEDARPETFVAHVIVTDADSGDNGRFTCSLSPPSVGDQFRLRATHDGEFQVVTSDEPLDRELIDRCVLQHNPLETNHFRTKGEAWPHGSPSAVSEIYLFIASYAHCWIDTSDLSNVNKAINPFITDPVKAIHFAILV